MTRRNSFGYLLACIAVLLVLSLGSGSAAAVEPDEEYDSDYDTLLTKVWIAETWLAAGVQSAAANDIGETISNFNLALHAFDKAEEFFWASYDFDWDYLDDYIDPGQRAAAHLGRGFAHLAAGNYVSAMLDAEVSRKYQASGMAYVIEANVHAGMGAKAKTIASYRALVESFPSETDLARQVRDVYFREFGERIPE